jgi:hypothetical protein
MSSKRFRAGSSGTWIAKVRALCDVDSLVADALDATTTFAP